MSLLNNIAITQHYAIITTETMSAAGFTRNSAPTNEDILVYKSYINKEEWETEIAKLDGNNVPYRAMIVNPVTVKRIVKIETPPWVDDTGFPQE